jgi:pyruvate carboxylase subunit B
MFPDIATIFLQERNAGTLVPEALLDRSSSESKGNHYAPSEFNITLHGESYHIKLTGSGHAGESERPFYVSVDGISEEVLVETLDEVLVNNSSPNENIGKEETSKSSSTKHEPSHEGCITTAMPGTIIEVKVKVGDPIKAGDSVVVIEAMKMENEIQAPKSGVVMAVHVAKGDNVSPNETLLEIQST